MDKQQDAMNGAPSRPDSLEAILRPEQSHRARPEFREGLRGRLMSAAPATGPTGGEVAAGSSGILPIAAVGLLAVALIGGSLLRLRSNPAPLPESAPLIPLEPALPADSDIDPLEAPEQEPEDSAFDVDLGRLAPQSRLNPFAGEPPADPSATDAPPPPPTPLPPSPVPSDPPPPPPPPEDDEDDEEDEDPPAPTDTATPEAVVQPPEPEASPTLSLGNTRPTAGPPPTETPSP